MNSTSSDATPQNAPASTHSGLLACTEEFTRTAFQALGLTAPQAAQAATEGGIVLNGTLVSVAPLPISSLTGQDGNDLYIVTVETPHCLEELSAQQLATMLAHGPGLLAVHCATLGCQPDGRIVLHRALEAGSTTPQDLADAMHQAEQLVQVLWGHDSDPQQQ